MKINITLLGLLSQLLWLKKLGENHEFLGDVLDKCNEVMSLLPCTLSEYYKRAISIPILDHLEREINSCFTELQSTAAKGMSIAPATLCVATTAASVKN